jgi:hypothetical protein
MASALVNTVPFDFQSFETEIIVGGSVADTFGIVSGIEKFDYSVKVNRTKFYGRSRLPLAMTDGDAEFEASISVDRFWFNYMIERSKELGIAIADLEMTISLVASAKLPGSNAFDDIHTIAWAGARFQGIKESGQHGPDAQMLDLPFDVLNIFWDGVDIFGNAK